MPNEENKKNEIIDYSKFFEREKKKEVEIPQPRKKFSFSFFENFWFEMDKKTKVELIIFLIVVAVTFGFLTFYFLEKAKVPESSLYPSSQRVDFLPYEE